MANIDRKQMTQVGKKTDFLGEYFWMKYFCEIRSHSTGLPKHLLEPEAMTEHCARWQWPVVLWWADLLRSYSIFSPCLESPASLGNGIQYLDKVLWLLAPAFQTQPCGMVGKVITERDPDGALRPINNKVRTEQPQNPNEKWQSRGKVLLERSSLSDHSAVLSFPLPYCQS